jgi:hypothetical protein
MDWIDIAIFHWLPYEMISCSDVLAFVVKNGALHQVHGRLIINSQLNTLNCTAPYVSQ